MATLAAYDIHSNLKAKGLQNVEIVCYTFAAPRTGNSAFARQYNAVVPNTWSVINDQVRARNDVSCKVKLAVQTSDLMTLNSVALTTRWPYDKGAVSAQHCMSACRNQGSQVDCLTCRNCLKMPICAGCGDTDRQAAVPVQAARPACHCQCQRAPHRASHTHGSLSTAGHSRCDLPEALFNVVMSEHPSAYCDPKDNTRSARAACQTQHAISDLHSMPHQRGRLGCEIS